MHSLIEVYSDISVILFMAQSGSQYVDGFPLVCFTGLHGLNFRLIHWAILIRSAKLFLDDKEPFSSIVFEG